MKRVALALAVLALGGSYQAILVTDDAHRFPPVSVDSVRLSTLHEIPARSVMVGTHCRLVGGAATRTTCSATSRSSRRKTGRIS